MTIQEILDQLNGTYGKHDTMTLLTNDTHFWSPFNPADAPESLFYRIEQYQEIKVLAQDPYTDTQIINNAIRLLMQSSIFSLKEFNDWEAITQKCTQPSKRSSGQHTLIVCWQCNYATWRDEWGTLPKIRICTTYSVATTTPWPPTTNWQNWHPVAPSPEDKQRQLYRIWSSKPSINSAPINTRW